ALVLAVLARVLSLVGVIRGLALAARCRTRATGPLRGLVLVLVLAGLAARLRAGLLLVALVVLEFGHGIAESDRDVVSVESGHGDVADGVVVVELKILGIEVLLLLASVLQLFAVFLTEEDDRPGVLIQSSGHSDRCGLLQRGVNVLGQLAEDLDVDEDGVEFDALSGVIDIRVVDSHSETQVRLLARGALAE